MTENLPRTRESVLDEVQEILEGVDPDLFETGELRVTVLTKDYNGLMLGKVTNEAGYVVVGPHPESASILMAREVYFDLLTKGPRLLRELAKMVENEGKSPSKTVKVPESAEIG
jgi:hypothetical protein